MHNHGFSLGNHARLGLPRTNTKQPITAGEREVLCKRVCWENDLTLRVAIRDNLAGTHRLINSFCSSDDVPSFEALQIVQSLGTPIPMYASNPSCYAVPISSYTTLADGLVYTFSSSSSEPSSSSSSDPSSSTISESSS